MPRRARPRRTLAALAASAALALGCGGGGGGGGGGGEVTDPAVLVFETSSFDYGLQVLGAEGAETFTLRNDGLRAATALAADPGVPSAFDWLGGAFPGQGGTCGDTLEAGATCTVVVAYAPSGAGAADGALAVRYHDGGRARTVSLALTGAAAAPAVLEISGGPTHHFYQVGVDRSAAVTLQVTNLGGFAATELSGAGLEAPYTFAGGSFPGTGGTCGEALPPLSTCAVVIDFAPSAPGDAAATFTVGYHDGAVPRTATRPLDGTGVEGALLVFAPADGLQFGAVGVGRSLTRVVTLTNVGAAPALNVQTSFLLAPGFTRDLSAPGSCPSQAGQNLAAGASCTLTLTFTPSATGPASAFQAAIYVVSLEPYVQRQAGLDLRGTGVDGPALVLSPQSSDLGARARGSSSAVELTLSNVGTAEASGIAIALAFSDHPPTGWVSGPFSYTQGDCLAAGTLAPGQSCPVRITFAPTATGDASVNVLVTRGGTTATAAWASLRAFAVSPASVAAATPAVDFGPVLRTATATRAVTLRNLGGYPADALGATVAAPFAFAGGTFPGTGGTCAATLAPGGTCTVVVELAPAAPGAQVGALGFTYRDGAVLPGTTTPRTVGGTVALGGLGVAPAALVLASGASPYAFPDVVIGRSAARTITVQNAGGVAATALTGTSAAPFGFRDGGYPGLEGTCGATLAAGASCLVDLAFVPEARGPNAGTLALAFHDGVASRAAELALAGVALLPAELALAGDGAFGDQFSGATATRTLTLSNAGDLPATAVAPQLTGPFVHAGGAYPGAGGTCGTVLQPGASCTVVLALQPGAAGALTGSLAFGWEDGNGARLPGAPVALTAHVHAPALLVFPEGAAVDFGTVAVGTTATRLVPVRNDGGWPATVEGVGSTSPYTLVAGQYPGHGGTCGSVLAPGLTCQLAIAYTPTAAVSQPGGVSLGYHDGRAVVAAGLTVSGAGTTRAHLAVTDWPRAYYEQYGLQPDAPSRDFGPVGLDHPVDHVFHVTNHGPEVAIAVAAGDLAGPFAWTGGAFPGQGGTCAAALAPGASCTVAVTFTPAAAGPASGALQVAYESASGGTAVAERPLRGSGTQGAALAVFDFQQGVRLGSVRDLGPVGVGRQGAASFVVVNQGAGPAVNLAAAPFAAGFGFAGGAFPGAAGGDGSGEEGVPPCGTTLAPGARCAVVVAFAPTAPGAATGALALAYDDGLGARPVAQRALRSTGVDVALLKLALDGPAVLDLGVAGPGTTRTARVEVRNVGAVKATDVALHAPAAPFAIAAGTCGPELAPGAACAFEVSFAPQAAGAFVARAPVSYHDGEARRSAARHLSGRATTRAFLVIRDWPEQGFEVVPEPLDLGATGVPVSHTFTVANVGGADATALVADSGAGRFAVTGGTCGETLAKEATCTVEVAFAPSGDGLSAGALRVGYHDGGGAAEAARALVATSTSRGLLSVSTCATCTNDPGAARLDFGTAGVPVERTVYVRNRGAVAATVSGGTFAGAAFGWGAAAFPGFEEGDVAPPDDPPPCGAPVAPGASCRLRLAFTPPAGAAPHTGALTLAASDAGGPLPAAPLALAAASIPTALLELRDDPSWALWSGAPPLDLGAASAPAQRDVFLVNLGARAAEVATAAATAPFSFTGGAFPGGTPGSVRWQGDVPLCPAAGEPIAAGAVCRVAITFDPTGLTGQRSGALTIGWADPVGGAGGSLSRALTGLAVAEP